MSRKPGNACIIVNYVASAIYCEAGMRKHSMLPTSNASGVIWSYPGNKESLYGIGIPNYLQQSIFIFRCGVFFNAHLKNYNCLIHSMLQSFIEGQKLVRGGTDRGLLFCKETNKICKNTLFLEFLAYLHFVAWLNGLYFEVK